MRARIVVWEVTCDRCGKTERHNVNNNDAAPWEATDVLPVVEGWADVWPAVPLGWWPGERRQLEVCPDCLSDEERKQREQRVAEVECDRPF